MAKKFWIVADNDGDNRGNKFATREEADAWASERASFNENSTFFVMEAVAVVQQPKPPVEIVAL